MGPGTAHMQISIDLFSSGTGKPAGSRRRRKEGDAEAAQASKSKPIHFRARHWWVLASAADCETCNNGHQQGRMLGVRTEARSELTTEGCGTEAEGRAATV